MKQFALRIEDDLYEFIKKEAEKNNLSCNSMILKILSDSKNNEHVFYQKTEESLKYIINLVKDVQKVSTASVLIARESLKESSKSGFFTENYVRNEETGGDDAVKQMNSYVNTNDRQTVNILKDSGVL